VKLKFEIEEREYVFDWEMSIREAMFVQEKAHVAPTDLWPALDRRDPAAVAAFVYIVKRRGGEVPKWDDILDLNVLSFKTLPSDEEESAEDVPVNEVSDPPKLATVGKTQKAGTKNT
jgi:hypothetical protein